MDGLDKLGRYLSFLDSGVTEEEEESLSFCVSN